ncbi:unnamed protein product, partial [Staurois parvus]
MTRDCRDCKQAVTVGCPHWRCRCRGEKTVCESRTLLDRGTGRTKEQVLLHSRVEQPAQYSNMAAARTP